MRKKYLSALLFGVLLVASTGTFTSCKDYDDDINNLQEQISGQEGVSTKISAIESTISSLQSAQSGLQSAIDAAESAAQQAALAAQNAAIEAAKADLEAAKAELQAAATADKEELQAAIATVNETLAGISGSIQTLEQFKTNTEASLEALAQADTNLQNAITDLEASVAENAKQIAANKAAIEAQVAALDKYKALTGADIDALKASIEAIEAGQLTEEMTNKIAEQVTEAVGAELDLISAAFSKAVTFVTIVNPYLNGSDNADIQGSAYTLDLRTATARVDYTFGKDEAEASMYEIANQREFKKGERAFLSDSIIIRVSPTNAVLTPQQISFVNSEKQTLDQLVTIESVEPVKGMVTRGISANGLWKVNFKLNETNYKDEAYNAASKYDYTEGMDAEKIKDLKNIMYAVAVKDSPEDTERYVTSGYDLTLGNEYDFVYNLEFMVNDESYTNIRNRFLYAEERTNDYTNDNGGRSWVVDSDQNLLYDNAWELDSEGELQEQGGTFLTEVDGSESGERTIYGKRQKYYTLGVEDNRNSRPFFMVKPNEAFTVKLGNRYTTDEELAGIYGFYVTLDANRAVESAPSEINAWNSYEPNIEGLNQITTGNEITLNIKDDNANGDIVGFRVYAINQDGTLVDPDGKAFYVSVGDISQIEMTNIEYMPTNISDQTITDIEIPSELTQLFSQSDQYYATDYEVDFENNPVVTKNGNTYRSGFGIDFVDENGNITWPQNAETIQIRLWDAPWTYKDGGTYSLTFNIRNGKDAVVRTVKVSFTKEMPTFPSEFSMKNNQLTNGAKEVVVDFNNWNINPVHNLGTAFNGISTADNAIVDWNYTFTSDNDQIVFNSDWINNDNRYGFYLDVDNMDEAAKLFSDKNTTDKVYNVTVGYVYEGISSESDNANYEVDAPTDKNFKMRLVCGNGLTSEWKKYDSKKAPIHEKIVYGDPTTRIAAANILKLKEGNTDITGRLTANQIKDCHLATGGVNDEYFTVEFDATTQEFVFKTVLSNNPPVSDIKGAELKFTLVDVFGHENPESYKYIDITLK